MLLFCQCFIVYGHFIIIEVVVKKPRIAIELLELDDYIILNGRNRHSFIIVDKTEC